MKVLLIFWSQFRWAVVPLLFTSDGPVATLKVTNKNTFKVSYKGTYLYIWHGAIYIMCVYCFEYIRTFTKFFFHRYCVCTHFIYDLKNSWKYKKKEKGKDIWFRVSFSLAELITFSRFGTHMVVANTLTQYPIGPITFLSRPKVTHSVCTGLGPTC